MNSEVATDTAERETGAAGGSAAESHTVLIHEALDEHGPMLFRVARRLTGHDHDAEEILQECFVTACSRIGDLRDRAALAGWLRKIVVNAALMRLRARRNETLGLPAEADGQRPAAWLSAGWVPRPDQLLMRRESRQVIQEAVARLPDGARTVYVLTEIEGMPYPEVADLLDISEGAVRTRLHRARLALRDELLDYFTDDDNDRHIERAKEPS